MRSLRKLPLGGTVDHVLGTVDNAVVGLRALAEAGVLTPVRPDRLAGMSLAFLRYGISPAAGYAAGAARHPQALAVIDDRGSLTYEQVHRRSNAVAHALADRGVRAGDAVALLARNSACFLIAQVAVSKLGADLVYLNTGFGGPQLAGVLDDEGAVAVIADAEFDDIVAEAAGERIRIVAFPDGPAPAGALTLDELGEGDESELPRTPQQGRHVILTSGTTGKPKGAPRTLPSAVSGLEPAAAMLSAIPLRARQRTVVAAPMFHAWGFGHLTLGMVLGSTLVLTRRFDPEKSLALVAEHGASTLAVVPVMMQRIADLPEQVRSRYDTSSLRVVAVSGSALSVELTERFQQAFGEVVYNLYGSTEVAYTSVATPRDFREAPGSVGRPLRGVSVRIVDDEGNDRPCGEVGKLFVGNSMTFAGYTGGADKERLGGLVATGDVGRIDENGRLWVTGRADDMIISGGENVYPAEVEDLLAEHPAVAEAAVVGVPDEKFGQRLVAHVVLADGAQADADALRAHVKKSLANYKVPREVVFHDELPRNETGKVLKRVLREPEPDESAGEKEAASGPSAG